MCEFEREKENEKKNPHCLLKSKDKKVLKFNNDKSFNFLY